MTQTVPATAVLGPGKTGLTIGVTVLNIDGTEYAAFSASGVAETSVAGTYRKASGVTVPDAGGYLVWGESGTDYAEATVDPKPAYAGTEMDLVDAPNATAITAIQSGLSTYDGSDTSGVTTLLSRLTATRAGYLDNLSAGAVALQSTLSTVASNVSTILGRIIGTIASGTHEPQSGDSYARLGAPAGASIAADIAAISAGTGLTAQQTRDAMTLAPSAGTPAAGSIDDLLGDILEDTGTTLPGLMAAELSNTSDSTASGAITRTRGNTWTINATIGAITGYTSLWFTVKHDKDDADSDAILQIKLNSTGSDDDLLYVNGATASDSTLGTITVSDASTGAIVIAVDETVTDDMPAGAFYYDVQVLNSGAVTTPDSGKFTITADVTRSVT